MSGYWRVVLVAVAVLAVGCSDTIGNRGQEPSPPTERSTSDACSSLSSEVVAGLDAFLEPFEAVGIEEFLAAASEDRLRRFQGETAARLAQNDVPIGLRCEGLDLEAAIAQRLEPTDRTTPVRALVIDSILSGGDRAVRDVFVQPGDDLGAILALLDSGSTITFDEGVFDIDQTVLIQNDLTIRGSGIDETIVRSSAPEVGLVALGGATLRLEALTFEHTGAAPATVLLSLGAGLELDGVRVAGATAGADGQGGSGVVLRESADGGVEQTLLPIVIRRSEIVDNEIAGVVAAATAEPTISDTVLADNAGCGICFFDAARGLVESNRIEGNGIGIQIGDQAAPEVRGNEIVGNTNVGIAIDDAAPTISANRFEANGQSAIEVGGAGAPALRENVVGAHPVAFVLAGTSRAVVARNEFDGSDVAIQLSEQADPTVSDSVIRGSSVAAVTSADDAAGSFNNIAVTVPAEAIGFFMTDRSRTVIAESEVDGGGLGASIGGDSTSQLSDLTIRGTAIGIDVRDNAQPTLTRLQITETVTGGVVYSGNSAGELSDSTFTSAGDIAVQTGESSAPSITANTIDFARTGIFVIDDSEPVIADNTLTGQVAGIEVADNSRPGIRDNRILDAEGVALSFSGDSRGVASGNSIFDPAGIGIQVSGRASPSISANVVGGPATDPIEAQGDEPDEPIDPADTAGTAVGVLYAEEATGTASNNQVFNFVIGIQVGDLAAPTLRANTVDGSGLRGVGILYGDESKGRATGNRTRANTIGIQLTGQAQPQLDGNTIESADQVAILLTESSHSTVRDNTCPSGVVGIAVIDDAIADLGENRCSSA